MGQIFKHATALEIRISHDFVQDNKAGFLERTDIEVANEALFEVIDIEAESRLKLSLFELERMRDQQVIDNTGKGYWLESHQVAPHKALLIFIFHSVARVDVILAIYVDTGVSSESIIEDHILNRSATLQRDHLARLG